MFEVGFQELALIFGVALIVLGPKRLSGLVTTVGRWVGKARTMARDFRQQLENEVNLEELNRMTDLQTRQARENPAPPPPPSPEYTGESVNEVVAAEEPKAVEATPTYPYSVPDAAGVDDTYSHAHASGAPPMPYSPEPVADAAPIQESWTPSQASLDLDTPPEEDDLSHLPPDDARRNA